MLAPTSSLLSRLRFRSAADKLPASHFLLVMPSAKEMEKWMAALREEIEGVGGKEARVDTAVRQWTEEVTGRDGFNELKKTPSKSHRYRVNHEEKSETATLDGIERQADQLAEGAQSSLRRNAPEHDAQSTSSSIALSEQQKRLSSIGESRRMSHATVATTIAPSSRANSMTGSAHSEYSNKDSPEAKENVPTKSPYRMLASYAPEMESLASSRLARDRPLPALPSSPRKLGVATSEPNLRNAASTKKRHDSKMPSPPPSLEEAARPESVVGELPSPSNWNTERSPSRQASTFHAASSDAQQPALRMVEPSQPRRSSGPKSFSLPLRVNPPNHNCPPRRSDTGPFNPVIDNKKARELRPSDSTPEPSQKLPAYLTPTTSLQPLASPKAGNNFRQPSRAPSGNLSLFPPSSPAISQPGTASPNDSPGLSPHSPHPGVAPGNPPRALRRPTSMQVRSNPAPFLQTMRTAGGAGNPSAAGTSSRSFTAPPPIRSLKPSRSSTNILSPSSSSSQQTPAPHRLSLLPTPSSQQNLLRDEESADQHTPLPSSSSTNRCPSPLPPTSSSSKLASRPTSTGIPTSSPASAPARKPTPRSSSSLPELDLGLPVVGLGPPPAPAPKVPLPAPPSQSQSSQAQSQSQARETE
ncbi:hypothetical protein KC334_g17628, partial [Hortaea werneckii]